MGYDIVNDSEDADEVGKENIIFPGEYVRIEDTTIDPNSNIGLWFKQMLWSEKIYIKLVAKRSSIDNTNWSPQQARSVLPNSLKTEIVITGNLREW